MFYERSQQLADESFAALSELDSVARSWACRSQTVESFTRNGGGPFGAERKVIDAAFANDVLIDRQNSQPISLGDDRVVVLRVTSHSESRQQTLAEVRAAVEAEVRAESARAAATRGRGQGARATERRRRLGGGRAAGSVVTPAGQVTVERRSGEYPPELVTAVFAATAPAGEKPTAGKATLASGDPVLFVVNARRAGSSPAAGAHRRARGQAAGGIWSHRGIRSRRLHDAARTRRADQAQRQGIRVARRHRGRASPHSAFRLWLPRMTCRRGCSRRRRRGSHPVMPEARSEQRKAATLPTSSIVTLRRSGVAAATCVSILRKPPMPAAASVLIGPAEIALTRVSARAEVGRQEAHVRLEARLGESHHVVARDRAHRAEVGEREERAVAPFHERPARLRERREAVARDVVRDLEALARDAVEKPPASCSRGAKATSAR